MYIKLKNKKENVKYYSYNPSARIWVGVSKYGEELDSYSLDNHVVGAMIGEGLAFVEENPTFEKKSAIYPIIRRDICIDGWYWYIFKNFSFSWCKAYGFRLAHLNRDYSRDTSLIECSKEELEEALQALCGVEVGNEANK